MASNPATGPSLTPGASRPIAKVLVATTAMLAFISFWRAAAIVLNDLASSAYYAGGEAEGYIGKTAPWFILAIMLFSYAVRSVYVESCSMFVRGGVYRAVKQSLGGTLAKFSVSALMFDYILTDLVSGAPVGQYLSGPLSELSILHSPQRSVPRTNGRRHLRYVLRHRHGLLLVGNLKGRFGSERKSPPHY